jgi:hypothetical protein
VLKELADCLSVGFVHELGDGKLARPVYTNKEIDLALHRVNFGDIDMKEAPLGRFAFQIACRAMDGVSLKLRPLWLITLNVG